MEVFKLTFLFTLLCSCATSSAQKCLISDSHCLTAIAQENVATFVQGLPDIHVERLDPLRVEYLKKEKDGLIFEAKNMEKEGWSNAIIDEVSIDMASQVMRLAFHANLTLKGQYKVDGVLFSIPISGEGDMVITKKHEYVELTMPFEIFIDPNGKRYMYLKSFTYNFGVRDGAKFWFGNLYYGDQEKSDKVQAYINENWKVVIEVFGPMIVDEFYSKIFNALSTFMRSMPLEDLQF